VYIMIVIHFVAKKESMNDNHYVHL